MAFFPFFIDIADKKILIAGGGNVALRKAQKLLQYGADITVTAPEICAELERLDGVTLIRRGFTDSDADGAFAVIAATDDRALNSHIYELCTRRSACAEKQRHRRHKHRRFKPDIRAVSPRKDGGDAR